MELSEFTILIADDDLSLLKIYEKSLSVEGYRLILVVNDKRALAELGKTPIDLLILDHGVLTILPLIERDYPKLPVIVVSGNYEGLMKDYEKKGLRT
jgi:DNA-binding NtrC family response regulator